MTLFPLKNIRNLFARIEEIPPIVPFQDRRFFVFCNYMFLYSFLGHLTFQPIFYYMDNGMVLFNNTLCLFLDIMVLALNRRGRTQIASFLWLIEISYHASYCVLAFGWNFGFQYYFLTMSIIVFFSRWHIALQVLMESLLCVACILLFKYSHAHAPYTEITSLAPDYFHASNVLANFIGLSYAAFYYRKYSDQAAEKLHFQATHDRLTGVLNRSALLGRLTGEILRAGREGTPLGIIMIDIDHFKRINDDHGHLMGDRILIGVTRILCLLLRAYDSIGRYGGEEFMILLPGCDLEKTGQIGECLRALVEAGDREHSIPLPVTMSAGVVALESNFNHTVDEVIEASDRAMYSAKKKGRNRVERGDVL